MKKIIFTYLAFFLLSSFCIHVVQAQNLQISGGNNFSTVVCNQQVVNVTGYNADGQLGVDATGNPLAAGLFRSGWQPVTRGTLGTVPMSTAPDVMPALRQADAGSGGHLLGLDCNKNVWAWGLNDFGQLGRNVLNGTHAERSVPMRVLKGAQVIAGNFLGNIKYVSGGNNSSFAIEETTGRVLAWGSNDYGQLGDGTIINRLTPVYVLTAAATPLTNIVQIEAGDDCSFALDASGQVWSWGITHDGANAARNIGRAIVGEIAAVGGGGRLCVPYAGRVERGTNDNGNAATNGFLNNIVSISGGDAHGLGIDVNGQVWSWGGDWAVGQIGQGNGGQYNYKAGRVADIGTTSSNGPFLGGGTLNPYKAISVAAGQSSCAIVLQDTTAPTNINMNRVVTFGSNGFYSFNTMITQPATYTFVGNRRFNSGTLGRGSCGGVTDLPQGTQNENTNATSFEYPVFVETAAGVPLTGVTTVSDGDAWYFATNDVGGNAVSWGWNRRGELASGTFGDQCYAASMTLPTGCAFDYPCPEQPDLPPNFASCPTASNILNSQIVETQPTYEHRWFRRTNSGDAWVLIGGQTAQTYTATSIGQYKVEVYDTRLAVSFLCGACPIRKDSVIISEVPNPYTTGGCAGTPSSTFTIETPTTSLIKWYTALTGGTLLNPTDELTDITTANTNAPVTAACGPGVRALFAEDISSTVGFVFPTGQLTPTQPQIETAMSCATLSANAGNQSYLAIQVLKNVKLTSVSVLLKNGTGNPESVAAGTLNIFTNNPASLWNGSYNVDNYSATHVAGSPTAFTAAAIPAGGTAVVTIALNINLTPGIYWINANGNYNIQPYFNCSPALQGAYPGRWTTPVYDNAPGNNTIAAIAARSPANSNGYSSKGGVFDLKFETGTGYSCGRILVCQSSTACPLPVNLLSFEASKEGSTSLLEWATSSEYNSDYFSIQRSTDGINWVTIGQVKAAGTSSSVKEYSFIDSNPSSSIVYYKLEEVDLNGDKQYSEIRQLEFINLSNISVFPNPNNGNFSLIINSTAKNATITFKNTLGQIVSTSTEPINGSFKKEYTSGNLSKGVYIISVETESDYKNIKLNIE